MNQIMKSIIRYSLLLCLALVCGFLASCADDLLVTPTTDTVGQPLELTVSQTTIPATRLELGQDGLTTVWQPRDQLVLVKKDRSSAPIYLNCTLTEPASSATFASESGVPAGDYWVIYNYNENLAYGHHSFSSVDEINEQNKLVLYGELNLTAGTSTASVEMHHLYAQVMVELKNVPDNVDMSGYTIGMYSSKKGMPIYKQFAANGLVNAEYGVNPNDLNNYNNNSTYFPSDKRWHNIRFGQYNVKGTWIEGYNDPDTGDWVEGHFQTSGEQFSNSALVLPEDLSQEEVFFYVITNEGGNSKCYEIKKALGKVNLKAGIRYKVVLDLAETDANTTVSTLNFCGSNGSVFEISTPTQWRHATYKGDRDVYGASNYGYKIADNIDFTGEYFFPLNTKNIDGNEKTLSNIELDWSDEDNVGLYKTEWIWNTWNDVTHTSDNGHMETVQPKQSYCNISNLTLESVTIKGKNYVGAFGGYNVRADNCKVIGTSVISGSGDYVGGIVGWNRLSSDEMDFRSLLSEVSVGQNCTLTGANYIGGIVGAYEQTDNWLGQFTSSRQPLNNCVSSATVTATGNYVGGIFGKIGGYNTNNNSSTIEFTMDDYTYTLLKCQNKGSVTGKDYVGGIGGDFALACYSGNSVDRVVLRQSFSDGKVKGDNYVGGILGRSMVSLNTCYSINSIEGTSNVGGIVGILTGDMMGQWRIANCYSLSALTVGAEGVAGGIVGAGGMGATVINSYFAGTNPTDCGIIGNSAGYCTVDHCLTTLPSLGTNLDTSPTARPSNPREEYDSNTGQWIIVYDYYPDAIIGSEYNVTSILDKKTVINGDNAYSDNYWPLDTYPYYCVKFDSFSADTDAPDYKDDVIN